MALKQPSLFALNITFLFAKLIKTAHCFLWVRLHIVCFSSLEVCVKCRFWNWPFGYWHRAFILDDVGFRRIVSSGSLETLSTVGLKKETKRRFVISCVISVKADISHIYIFIYTVTCVVCGDVWWRCRASELTFKIYFPEVKQTTNTISDKFNHVFKVQ